MIYNVFQKFDTIWPDDSMLEIRPKFFYFCSFNKNRLSIFYVFDISVILSIFDLFL